MTDDTRLADNTLIRDPVIANRNQRAMLKAFTRMNARMRTFEEAKRERLRKIGCLCSRCQSRRGKKSVIVRRKAAAYRDSRILAWYRKGFSTAQIAAELIRRELGELTRQGVWAIIRRDRDLEPLPNEPIDRSGDRHETSHGGSGTVKGGVDGAGTRGRTTGAQLLRPQFEFRRWSNVGRSP